MVAHNDIAPHKNPVEQPDVCCDGDELVGIFDRDLPEPSTPRLELAFIAWSRVAYGEILAARAPHGGSR